jgi:hypothetical protein
MIDEFARGNFAHLDELRKASGEELEAEARARTPRPRAPGLGLGGWDCGSAEWFGAVDGCRP